LSFRHRIVLTGGGTGGHIYPALSVAEQLKKDESVEAVLYIGAKGHLEEKLAVAQGLDFLGLSISGLPRQLSTRLVTWPYQTLRAVSVARREIEHFNPTVLLGTGGYASAPPLAAAFLSGRPFAIHEPDAHPGLVNRVFAPYASLISLGMAQAKEQLGTRTRAQIVVNGNPVSKRFTAMPAKDVALKELGFKNDCKTILITGGSQGALALNKAVYELLGILKNKNEGIQVIHQVGEKNWDEMEASLDSDLRQSPLYRPRKYFDNLEVAYAVSDLTVCRAGAMTIAELFLTGTPAIFVPYPFAAADHQTYNARFVEAQGAAKVILQSDLSGRLLYEIITALLLDQEQLANMRKQMLSLAKPNAAYDIAEQLKRLSCPS